MTISMEEETAVSFDFDHRKLADDIIHYVLDREGFPFDAEVNVILTDNAGIRAANKEYRQIDRATDVLSFPLISYEKAGDWSLLEADANGCADCFHPDSGEAMLGDILISVDRVAEQAERYGHSQKREYASLIVHSMLHLLGYDHMTEAEAAVMEELQRTILHEMKIDR